jgi:hypothetical protein
MRYSYSKKKLLCDYAMCTWGILSLMQSKWKANTKEKRPAPYRSRPFVAIAKNA